MLVPRVEQHRHPEVAAIPLDEVIMQASSHVRPEMFQMFTILGHYRQDSLRVAWFSLFL